MCGHPCRCAAYQSCKPATRPRHGQADLRLQMPTRKLGVVHSGADTTRVAAVLVAPLQIYSPPAPAEHSGTPGPMRHTRDTPICPASKSRPRCKGASTGYCGRSFVLQVGEDC